MLTFFNENDSFAADWLRRLYPEAVVDTRSIVDVEPTDLVRFTRCHFFGGIGGWEYALQLADWPIERSVWTGSCPCQPLSCAGKREGETDERHLWPEFYRLISECRPATIFGEQVASKDGLEWLDGISLDLEEIDYAVCAADLPAAGKGAPHIRQRFWWAAVRQLGDSNGARRDAWSQERQERGEAVESMSAKRGEVVWLADSSSARLAGRTEQYARRERQAAERSGDADGLGHAAAIMGIGGSDEPQRGSEGRTASAWANSAIIPCTDNKLRRISAEPGDEPLAARIPVALGSSKSRLRRMGQRARANRVGRLRGYGNAICPQAAATFVRAFMEATAAASSKD